MSAKLEGRTAIVTGAGRGVGRGVALLMAREGAKVVGCGRRQGVLDEVVAKVEAAGGTAMAVSADLSKHEDAERVVQAALDEMEIALQSIPNDWVVWHRFAPERRNVEVAFTHHFATVLQ